MGFIEKPGLTSALVIPFLGFALKFFGVENSSKPESYCMRLSIRGMLGVQFSGVLSLA